MEFVKIVELIQSASSQEVKIDFGGTSKTLTIDCADLTRICKEVYHNPSTYFDMLSCITGIDNGVEANTMEVVYNLYSIPFHQSLMLRVILPRENPVVDSLCSVWKSANWLEREVYDMFGIQFNNHPDLRRILMPNDWEGFPLKKDYQHQELYRGIEVKANSN